MSAIIFAASGAGKSTWRKHAYTGKWAVPVVDGDAVIGGHKLWPKGKTQWWLDKARAGRIYAQHAEVIIQLMRRNTDVTVVWWTRLSSIVPRIRKELPETKIVGVQVPIGELRRNWDERNRMIDKGISGHSKRTWASYEHTWECAKNDFIFYNIPTFPSFDAAAKDLGIYVSQAKEFENL